MANTLALKLDEIEENEKLTNNIGFDQNLDNKKTIATQVDYVALIVSRNNDDLPDYTCVDTSKVRYTNVEENNQMKSHPQAPYTIHSDNNQLSKSDYF